MLVEFVIGAPRDMLGKVHTAKLHTLQCSHGQSAMKEGKYVQCLTLQYVFRCPIHFTSVFYPEDV